MKRWEGDTVCIVASGPSLTRADCDYARRAARRVIVVNNSWKLCPAADVLYAADAPWWKGENAPSYDAFKGERWSSTRNDWTKPWALPVVNKVKTRPGIGFPDEPPLCEGSNSAYQALGLAVMWGASKVVFLGLDLQRTDGKAHWHEDHRHNNPGASALAIYAEAFKSSAAMLTARGVEVINASRATALDCFPKLTVTHALP